VFQHCRPQEQHQQPAVQLASCNLLLLSIPLTQQSMPGSRPQATRTASTACCTTCQLQPLTAVHSFDPTKHAWLKTAGRKNSINSLLYKKDPTILA
jgi:hypothetical protein